MGKLRYDRRKPEEFSKVDTGFAVADNCCENVDEGGEKGDDGNLHASSMRMAMEAENFLV